MSKLPNLIIAGVNKAGTSSLFTYLAKHPEVCGSTIKETCYFLPTRYGKEMEEIEKYKSYFQSCKNEKYILEATPGYFYGGRKTAEYIKNIVPDVKIVLILRNPEDRAFSFFNHAKAKLWLDKNSNFNECLESREGEYCNRAIEESRYHEVKEWLEVFEKNLEIFYFEDLEKSPKDFMKKISKVLQIEPSFYEDYFFEVENKTVKPKNILLHSIALKTYGKFEKYLRKHTKLKNRIRDIYYKLNTKSKNSNYNRDKLEKILKNSKLELKEILEKNGKEIPSWLK
jgi:hypothetical protein